MSESLGITETQRVLEIGTGSGYQAAVLAEIAKEVYSIKIKEKRHKKATGILQSMGLPMERPGMITAAVNHICHRF